GGIGNGEHDQPYPPHGAGPGVGRATPAGRRRQRRTGTALPTPRRWPERRAGNARREATADRTSVARPTPLPAGAPAPPRPSPASPAARHRRPARSTVRAARKPATSWRPAP